MFYFAAGAALLLVAGLVNAGYGDSGTSGASTSVNVAVYPSYPPVYSHYCNYYYGYYYCQPYAGYGPYCDPFDPFYYQYCYLPYSTYYPTYTVNPGTVVYTASGAPQQQKPLGPPCSDSTPAGFCSPDFPKYCQTDGNSSILIDKATLCGCPQGEVQDPTNKNRCIQQTCEDGTSLNSCSATKPKFCTSNAFLIDKPQQCGCPSGTKLEGNSCISLSSMCFVASAGPSTIRTGETSTVTVSFDEVQSPANGFVNCGNGNIVGLACQGHDVGTCLATCSYSVEGSFTVQAYVNGQLCSSSASVTVVPQLASTGDVLTRVTDCATGVSLPGSTVIVNGQQLVTDANGEARASGLNQGTLFASAARSGYLPGVATTVVNQGSTSILPICLNKVQVPACDVSAEFVGVITTNNVQNGVQVKVTNNLHSNNTAVISYSSVVPLNGPQSVSLLPEESKIVNIFPQVEGSFSGSSVASITVTGSQACSVNLALPLNLETSGLLSLIPLTKSQSTYAGGKACFDFLVSNTGQETKVNLVASSSGLTLEFDASEFLMSKGENRNAKLCASVPQGGQGQRTISVNALGNVNNASTSVQLSINPFMYSNVLGCFNVDKTGANFFEVKLTNTGQANSFVARLLPSPGFRPRLTQENIFNFVNNSPRSLFVQVDESAMVNLHSLATLSVFTKDSDVKVFEQELCFEKPGTFDSTAFLSPSRLVIEQGKTGKAFVHIENTGDFANSFEVEVVPTFPGAELVSSSVSVLPREEKSAEIAVSPAFVLPGTYNLPVVVYSMQNPAMRIQVASFNLIVEVKTPTVATASKLVVASPPAPLFNQSTSTISLLVPVTNYEDVDRIVSATLTDLPPGWVYTVSPKQVKVPKLSSTTFNFTITSKDIKSTDYNASVVLTDELGRQTKQNIVLPAKTGNWPLTGLVIFGSASQLFVVLIFVLLLLGLYFLYKAWLVRQEVNKQHELLKA